MALIYPQSGDLTKSLKSARKKVPQSARLSAGGGGQKLKGQCPNAPCMNLRKASLSTVRKLAAVATKQKHIVLSFLEVYWILLENIGDVLENIEKRWKMLEICCKRLEIYWKIMEMYWKYIGNF